EIYDALMVVCPRGWRSARLRFERAARGGLRLSELTSAAGDGPHPPRPDLRVERGAFIGVINEAFSDLEAALRAEPAAWWGLAASVDRDATGGATLALRDGDALVRT